ncbi:MAG TPA: hypothetical protein VGG85_09790 [Terracidiphilus sp.]
MKLLRSITRRGFNVGTAGWFTVLKPNTWFPASRLPGHFRYRNSQSAETTAVNRADSREPTKSPQIMIPTSKDRRLMRPALIVLTAMMVTSGLLWWIMHP